MATAISSDAIKAQQPDRIVYDHGFAYVQPAGDQNPLSLISCEVLGASVLTQWRPGFNEMFYRFTPDLVKPAPGWCMPAVISKDTLHKVLPVNTNWPINMGKIGNIIGVQCTVNDDGMGFTCDWPPYGNQP